MAVFSRLSPLVVAALVIGGLAVPAAVAQGERGLAKPGERAAPRPQAKPDGKAAEKAPPKEPVTRAQVLDELFRKLAGAGDAEEAKGLATAIERVFLRSGSDTADLLMGRALQAVHRNNAELAEDLIDRIIALEPDWAEAYYRRATLRAMREDGSGAVEDLAHTLKLEPRHFAAMTGLGFTLLKLERKPQALRVLKQSLTLNPQGEAAKKAVERLELDLDGRSL